MRLLLAEADESLALRLQKRFHECKYYVRTVISGSELLCVCKESIYDLLLIDLNLPGISGLSCVPAVQIRLPGVPIILWSTEDSVEYCVHALEAGADDFLVNPFAVAELVARTQAVLRRHSQPMSDVYMYEGLEVNRVTHGVSRGGRAIELAPKEYAVLEFLLRHPGQPVSRRTILDEVFCLSRTATTNVVDVYVNYLRGKLNGSYSRQLIHTIRGVGYQIGGSDCTSRGSHVQTSLEMR
jgi:DNA-binding response OmpR family regulator